MRVRLQPGAMVASRKAGAGSQGDKQSAVVQEFLAQHGGAATSDAPRVVSSAGFVPRTAETEAAKEASRGWDRSQLLKVDDSDAQVKIYNAYAENSNTSAEGGSSRRGLGSSEGTSAAPRRGFLNFVSAGGAPAATPAATATSSGAAPAAPAAPSTSVAASASAPPATSTAPLPPGWTMGTDPSSGWPYYANPSTGQTQWHPPPAQPAAPSGAGLPAGWVAAVDPASGHTYYTNPATGQSQWTPPLPPPTFACGGAGAVAAAAPMGSADPAVKVRGLPATMSDADVRELFDKCGRISNEPTWQRTARPQPCPAAQPTYPRPNPLIRATPRAAQLSSPSSATRTRRARSPRPPPCTSTRPPRRRSQSRRWTESSCARRRSASSSSAAMEVEAKRGGHTELWTCGRGGVVRSFSTPFLVHPGRNTGVTRGNMVA